MVKAPVDAKAAGSGLPLTRSNDAREIAIALDGLKIVFVKVISKL
jgi:hypothetical protein